MYRKAARLTAFALEHITSIKKVRTGANELIINIAHLHYSYPLLNLSITLVVGVASGKAGDSSVLVSGKAGGLS